MNPSQPSSLPPPPRRKASFGEDFRRFFVRGLAALLPTLITLWLLVKVWEFLWEALGRHIIWTIRLGWYQMAGWWVFPEERAGYIRLVLNSDRWWVQVIGVLLAILLVYIVGVFVGNFIGRQFWRLGEMAVMRIPLVRAIYPAVKQVTDLFLADHRASAFAASRVVAVEHRAQGVWTIGLVTGPGLRPLSEATGDDMVTVFVPSTPTAFSGYVVVVPRQSVIELPLSVEEAMRLLVSGGVLAPGKEAPAVPISPVALAKPAQPAEDEAVPRRQAVNQ